MAASIARSTLLRLTADKFERNSTRNTAAKWDKWTKQPSTRMHRRRLHYISPLCRVGLHKFWQHFNALFNLQNSSAEFRSVCCRERDQGRESERSTAHSIRWRRQRCQQRSSDVMRRTNGRQRQPSGQTSKSTTMHTASRALPRHLRSAHARTLSRVHSLYCVLSLGRTKLNEGWRGALSRIGCLHTQKFARSNLVWNRRSLNSLRTRADPHDTRPSRNQTTND